MQGESVKYKDKIIECKGICKTIGGDKILNNINLFVNTGEIIGITGETGVGKTTLMHILGLLDSSYEGQLSLFGKDINRSIDNSILRKDMAYIYQNHCLLNDLTVYENIVLFYRINGYKVDRSYIEKKIGFLKLNMDKGVNYLSGGEKQRVGIARALVQGSKILFADEITSSINDEFKHNIMDYLLNLSRNQGVAVLFVSHDENMLKYSDRVIELTR